MGVVDLKTKDVPVWHLETRYIDDLLANPQNPRTIRREEVKELQRSIAKYGLCQPIVANLDGFVIGGHQRLRSLRTLGYTDVEVYLPSRLLSARECDELGVRLNRNGGDFDYDLLASLFDVSDLIDWGFNEDELELDLKEKETPRAEPHCIFTLEIPEEQAARLEAELDCLTARFMDCAVKKKRR